MVYCFLVPLCFFNFSLRGEGGSPLLPSHTLSLSIQIHIFSFPFSLQSMLRPLLCRSTLPYLYPILDREKRYLLIDTAGCCGESSCCRTIDIAELLDLFQCDCTINAKWSRVSEHVRNQIYHETPLRFFLNIVIPPWWTVLSFMLLLS